MPLFWSSRRDQDLLASSASFSTDLIVLHGPRFSLLFLVSLAGDSFASLHLFTTNSTLHIVPLNESTQFNSLTEIIVNSMVIG